MANRQIVRMTFSYSGNCCAMTTPPINVPTKITLAITLRLDSFRFITSRLSTIFFVSYYFQSYHLRREKDIQKKQLEQ